MAQKKPQPISLKFLVLSVTFIIAFLVYATTPNEIKQIKKSQTFEEKLEYRNKNYESHTAAESIYNRLSAEEDANTRRIRRENNQQQKHIQTQKQPFQTQVKKVEKKVETDYTKDKAFFALLDELKKYSPKSMSSAEGIVRKILRYKGYPDYVINIVSEEQTNLKQKTQGSYVAAYFNIQTGQMHLNKTPLYQLNIEEVVAIIAHEIDHFDKVAKICKSMGTAEFVKMLDENKMGDVNYNFWERAQSKANIDDFDAKYYKDALMRYINQGQIDLASSYSDLYRLSEHMRNPLEISAYGVSDFIFNYYNLPNNEGPIRKMVKKFNSLDWAIYNLTSKNEILKDERIALFDYFFMQAIVKNNKNYQNIYYDCIQNKNGNMSEFWLDFERNHKSFYNKNEQMDEKTYDVIMSLLNETEKLANLGITNEEICDALKYKVNTLYANLVFPNAIKYMTNAANDYISFINRNKISRPEDELQMILLLICIENKLFKNSPEEIKNLYYIQIPELLTTYYPIKNKNQKFNFIYQNEAFKNILKKKKNENPSYTEQKLLSELLKASRPLENIK